MTNTLELEDPAVDRCVKIVANHISPIHLGDNTNIKKVAADLERLSVDTLLSLANTFNSIAEFDNGGVKAPGWFNLTITFQTGADAEAAALAFRGAGYTVERLNEIDPYSDAAWLTVSKFVGDVPFNDLLKQAEALADKLHGDHESHWLS